MSKVRSALAIANMLVLVLVFGAARTMGAHWNLIMLYWMLAAVAGGLIRIWGSRYGKLDWSIYRPDAARPVGKRWQAGIRVASWLVAGFAVQMAIITVQFEPGQLRWVRLQTAGLMGVAVAYALIPMMLRNWWSTIGVGIVGLLFTWDLAAGVKRPSTNVHVRSPFAEPATVFHGGGSTLLNHHAGIRQQRFALDIVLAPGGSEVVGDRDTLEGWACFAVPVLAIADGTVVTVRDDLPDQAIGSTDRENLVGNHVIVQIGDERYALYAHLKQGSAVVTEGQRVTAGEPLGACGNSGNTSQPHLHLQVQNTPGFSNHDLEQRTFGLLFDRVERGGRLREHAFARRNDVLLPD